MPIRNATVTQPYGIKNSKYRKGYHTGIDLVSDDYTVYAAVPGIIIESRYAAGRGADPTGWGNYVILRTKDEKHDIIHAHLFGIAVIKGQSVVEGTKLGVMGSTGNSTGPHLHFEVRKAPWTNLDDINPAVFLGIYNRKGPAESEEPMIKHLVLCNPGPDERAAGYLADYLKAPVCLLDNTTQEQLNLAQNIYVIGTDKKVSNKAVNIVGVDRYDTCRKVLDICQGK